MATVHRFSRGPRASLALALAAGTMSCGPSAPPARGAIVIGQITPALTLDPHTHDEGATHATLGHFYESLVGFGPEMQVRPALATTWENPSDTVWRFRLRRGVVFHDGRPFGAEDVVASLERALHHPRSRVSYYLRFVQAVRAVDDATVDVITRRPSPVLLNRLTFVAIVPRDAPERIERPIGTGPYEFVSGAAAGPIVGRRFARYWGAGPAFDQVTILPLPDAGERAEAVTKGRADVVAQFPPERWEWGGGQAGMRMLSRRGLAVSLLTFSQRGDSPFADRRVRQAVALGLDRAALAQRGTLGLAVPLDQIVPAAVFGHSPEMSAMIHDPDAARRLLAESGHAGGFEAALLLPDSLTPLGQEVAAQLAAIGLRVRPTVLPWAEFYQRWYKEPMPFAISYPWVAGSGDASDILDDLLHSPAELYGGSNRMGYHSAALDRTVERLAESFPQDVRSKLLAEALAIVRADAAVVPLLEHFDLYAVRPDLEWTPRLDQAVRAMDIRQAPVR